MNPGYTPYFFPLKVPQYPSFYTFLSKMDWTGFVIYDLEYWVKHCILFSCERPPKTMAALPSLFFDTVAPFLSAGYLDILDFECLDQ